MIESLGAPRRGKRGHLDRHGRRTEQYSGLCGDQCAGQNRHSEAAKSLGDIVKKAADGLKSIAADACLVCAERLSAYGKKVQAIALYKALSGEDQPKYVRLAATRGLLAAAKNRITRRYPVKTSLMLSAAMIFLAALSGTSGALQAADAAGQQLVDMVVDLVKDKDKDMRAIGFQQVREEVKGTAATKRFAELLPNAAARRPGRIDRRPCRSWR